MAKKTIKKSKTSKKPKAKAKIVILKKNGGIITDLGGKKIPKGVKSVIDGLVAHLRKSGVVTDFAGTGCGNPDCPVHGTHGLMKGETPYFVPMPKSQLDRTLKDVVDIASKGATGIVYVGRLLKGNEIKNIPVYSNRAKVFQGALRGSLKINQLSKQHILLSLISKFGITREEAVNIITDPTYQIEPGDPEDLLP